MATCMNRVNKEVYNYEIVERSGIDEIVERMHITDEKETGDAPGDR